MDDKFPSILWFLKLAGATLGVIILMCCLGAWLVHVARRNEEVEEENVDLDQSIGSYKVQQSLNQSSLWGQRQGLLEMTQTSSSSERRLQSDFILSPIALSSHLGSGHLRGDGDADSDSDFEMIDQEEAKVTTAMLGR